MCVDDVHCPHGEDVILINAPRHLVVLSAICAVVLTQSRSVGVPKVYNSGEIVARAARARGAVPVAVRAAEAN